MKRWRLWILLLVCVAVLAPAVIWKMRQEPRYGGRTLTEWLKQAQYGDFPDEPPPEAVEARDAIRAIGPHAVPALLRMLAAEDPKWKLWLADALARQRVVQPTFRWATEQHALAEAGFSALGPEARSALPELSRLMVDRDHSAGAAKALCSIGGESVPALRIALTNGNSHVRLNACAAALELGTNAHSLAPEVWRLRNDLVAGELAVFAMSCILAPGDSVPYLVEAAHTPRFAVALTALTRLGTNAQAALPALRELRDKTSLPPMHRKLIDETIAALEQSVTNVVAH